MELAFIRWFPAQVLFLTFFTNTVLLASFLGLSLGCLAARKSRNYLALTPILLIAGIASAAAMEWIRLALQDILDVGKNASSPQVVYFGTEVRVSGWSTACSSPCDDRGSRRSSHPCRSPART